MLASCILDCFEKWRIEGLAWSRWSMGLEAAF